MNRAVHNVVQLSNADVRDRFVVRGHELDELVAHLRENDPPRHALVIGQRGMGKSLLLRRVAVAIADDVELSVRWLPVLMPEELYEVTSIGELWLAALDRLATDLSDADLTAQHRALLAETDPSRMEALALQRLLAAARERGCKVLLLVENLDMLLGHQVASDEGWALRQALQTEHDLLLMATAVSTFVQAEEASKAFYGFFHRIDLRPLGDDDVRSLWRDVTGVDLAGSRAVPIRILTGGNPRLITVLGRFSEHPDLSNLRQDLELLIDDYTPYFKANIEALPPVERKVFVTLADIWAPATAAEVAERTRMSSSKVSALLGRLVGRGAIEIVDQEAGRQRYELSERLYNLYHLLRRPDGEGRVRALVDILTHLYGPDELLRSVLPGIVMPTTGAPPSALDTRIASGLQRLIDEAGVWDKMSPAELEESRPVFESLLGSQQASLGDDHTDTLLTRQQIACCVGRTGDPETALTLLAGVAIDQERILGLDDRHALRSRALIAYFTGKIGEAHKALELYRRVVSQSERALGPYDRDTLIARAQVAYYTGETSDVSSARELYRQLAKDNEGVRGPNDRDTLASLHGLAYYSEPNSAFEIAQEVVRRAEQHTLDQDDELLRAARGLHAMLLVQTGSRDLLPRELRDLQSFLTAPEGLPPDEP